MRLLKDHYPLPAALLMFGASLVFLYWRLLQQTGGALVYVLDDPYIHMAMAHNLSEHGIWGVSRLSGFAFCSSSPLWTALLAGSYRLSGPRVETPLVLNALAALAVILWTHFRLRRAGLVPGWELVALLVIVFTTSLPALAFTGMEHGFQTLICLVFAAAAADLLASERNSSGGRALLLALAPLVVLIRYEGMFLVGVVALLLLVRRKALLAGGLLALAALAVSVVGLWSLGRGWMFFPSSLLLKTDLSQIYSLRIARQALFGYRQLAQAPHLLVLLLAALLLLRPQPGDERAAWSSARFLLLIFLGTAALHLQFARLDHFFRYEAYLVALGLLSTATALGGPAGRELLRSFTRRSPGTGCPRRCWCCWPSRHCSCGRSRP